jgi:hypothetical protein
MEGTVAYADWLFIDRSNWCGVSEITGQCMNKKMIVDRSRPRLRWTIFGPSKYRPNLCKAI